MCSRGVLVHRPGCLSAAVAVFGQELPGCDGVLTKWALERRKAFDYLCNVMSHGINCSRLSRVW
jgi:hypothetical protein